MPGALFLILFLAAFAGSGARAAEAAYPSRLYTELPQHFQALLDAPPWGHLLLGFSFFILSMIIVCTRGAGEAYRSGNRRAFERLPARLDAEGLLQLQGQLGTRGQSTGAGVLVRSLRVGLVAGRGGLLISKSAVLSAWEAERSAFRLWPRTVLAAGLISLALGVLAAANQLAPALALWEQVLQQTQYAIPNHEIFLRLHRAQALLHWGLTNCFIALLLYFLFERVIQVFLDRTTRKLITYLGETSREGVAEFAVTGAKAQR